MKTKGKTSAERSRQFRDKLKEDKNRYQEAKLKDRIRKDRERQKVRKDPNKMKESTKKNTDYMRRYRQKKKAERDRQVIGEEDTRRSETGRKVRSRQLLKETRQKEVLEKKVDALKRREAVLRTQRWRLRVKIHDQKASRDKKESFKSQSTRYRAIQRVKQALPNKPKRKANIIENLMDSPRVSQIPEHSGIRKGKSQRHRVTDREVVQNLSKKFQELKSHRGTIAFKQEACRPI